MVIHNFFSQSILITAGGAHYNVKLLQISTDMEHSGLRINNYIRVLKPPSLKKNIISSTVQTLMMIIIIS